MPETTTLAYDDLPHCESCTCTSTRIPPTGCICEPASWFKSAVPKVCLSFSYNPIFMDCEHCQHEIECHVTPAPHSDCVCYVREWNVQIYPSICHSFLSGLPFHTACSYCQHDEECHAVRVLEIP